MSDEILSQKEIQEHIRKLYEKIDQTKNKVYEVALENKDNTIQDLLNKDEIKEEIKKMAGKQGRNSTIKWGSVIVALIELIRHFGG